MIHRDDHDGIAVLRIEHGKASALDLELCNANYTLSFIDDFKCVADNGIDEESTLGRNYSKPFSLQPLGICND